MLQFLHAHATHPDWRMGLSLALAQFGAQRESLGLEPEALTLGWVYLGEAYADEAEPIIEALRAAVPGVEWVGAVGAGVLAGGAEYIDEPGLAVMASTLPRERFRVFSGRLPLGPYDAQAIQVHADDATADLVELLAELSDRTQAGYLFGGLVHARAGGVHMAGGQVLRGGLSGVAFGPQVRLVSRVTQGCQPVGPVRTVTEADRNVVYTLDGEPALDCLLHDLGATIGADRMADARAVLPRLRATLAGLSDAGDATLAWPGQFGVDTRVRHLIGLEPTRRGLALADTAPKGMKLAFCQRNVAAARRDLVRICTEIREEAEAAAPGGAGLAGAVYISCAGRGGPHFGGPSAEMQLVRHALGDVPLVGYFAPGEIAHRHLYGYTGVLTAFLQSLP